MILLVILRDSNGAQRSNPLLVLHRREVDNTVLIDRGQDHILTACRLSDTNSTNAFANGTEITNKPLPIRHMQTLEIGPNFYSIVDGERLFLDGLTAMAKSALNQPQELPL